jgi:hypothetical protein
VSSGKSIEGLSPQMSGVVMGNFLVVAGTKVSWLSLVHASGTEYDGLSTMYDGCEPDLLIRIKCLIKDSFLFGIILGFFVTVPSIFRTICRQRCSCRCGYRCSSHFEGHFAVAKLRSWQTNFHLIDASLNSKESFPFHIFTEGNRKGY